MRDLFLVLLTFGALCTSFAYPFAGLLLWTWYSLMTPQAEAFGFAKTLPLNLLIAAVTLVSLVLSREKKLPAPDPLIWLCGLFLLWCTLNGFAAVDPDWSWPYWDRTWKVFALGLFAAAMVRDKVRLHALTWVIVVSLFYYGVKGGLFTLLSGGGQRVYGPEGTIIGDNNQLALALLMTLPLANYLRSQSEKKWVSLVMLACMGLTVVAILGTYSRGGFIGLAVLSVAAWLKFRKKLLYLIVAAMVLAPSLYFMPARFFHRVDSIDSYGTDSSFQGRVVAWHVAYDYARDHFPFGAGFYGPQLTRIFNFYYPNVGSRAAHSIYFQVLGEQGFIGLFLYLAILVFAFLKAAKISRACAGKPDKAWAGELTAMIQLGLLVFCLSGAALSMAYYDIFVLYLAMLLSLQGEVCPAAKLARSAPVLYQDQVPERGTA